MALRTIREFGDEVLNKECKEVTKMTLRTKVLINDMLDTMYEAMGVGLAAPQVGILKRIVVIDIGEGPIVLINPVILETSGEQTGEEGCLSLPGKAGIVTRPNYAKVKAVNEDMEEVILEGEGLLARAFCHEIDHLDGKLYTRLVEGEVHDVNYESVPGSSFPRKIPSSRLPVQQVYFQSPHFLRQFLRPLSSSPVHTPHVRRIRLHSL